MKAPHEGDSLSAVCVCERALRCHVRVLLAWNNGGMALTASLAAMARVFFYGGNRMDTDYRQTLNLPQTAFPMQANLRVRELNWPQAWKTCTLSAHDDIHTGTALHNIFKDMINWFWNLQDYDVVHVPSGDTHGLPLELCALKNLGHPADPLTLRWESAAVARYDIGVMTEEFKRRGVRGDWDPPYVPMTPASEGAELRVFADMVENGLIDRDLKSVYWCPHGETALAEGEIDYTNHEADSIYVAVEIRDPGGYGVPRGTRAAIWPTPPWTIPAPVAIAVHPEWPYVGVTTRQGQLRLGQDVVQSVMATLNREAASSSPPWSGKTLAGVVPQHRYLGHAVPIEEAAVTAGATDRRRCGGVLHGRAISS